MFNATLVKWDITLVDLEVKTIYNPFNTRYYPVPKTNKENFRKHLHCLVDIGVLTTIQYFQYGTPIFIIPKKEGTISFIVDDQKINQKIVINWYTLPIIIEMVHQLEGFQYATALDLNML